jgi:hypothetical protein
VEGSCETTVIMIFYEHSNSSKTDKLFSVKSEWMVGLVILLNFNISKSGGN